ncbi:exodeoxyribonuclease VII large subunit [Feifania hominis]|uniref:Exodeoxyribonuclease 7 large subunit n=1 Tax=Feifania hominis TaxID=2763660 RepID=A0A926DC83_9FIRM|nr:exodeoxyribonuclease VII large subunit [Feifania hominis]MBC8535546.1 exodeoxyribonuclease VII large subunit [Feifania hominis]
MQNESAVVSVSQLNAYIKNLIDRDEALGVVLVKGEISNFTNHYKTGHLYLTLKDEKSLIRAVMFAGNASRLKFKPENGMKVIAGGRVAVFERDGQYQLYIAEMQPDGVGSLHVAFEQLKAKLEAEGLFDERRKRPLPKLPVRVGVITAATGAAVRDILNILRRRYPLAEVYIYPTLVQGDGAPPQLIEALEYFNRTDRVDVIIMGRGGGSIEDLWAFNNEQVARAVAASHIPVISAVGHETDFTICDFVADRRAPTPSAAAELCVPETQELKQKFKTLAERMALYERRAIERKRQRVRSVMQSRAFRSPRAGIDDRRMNVMHLTKSLIAELRVILGEKSKQFVGIASKLDALSPLAILTRGYAIVRSGGRVLRSVEDFEENAEVTTIVSDGRVRYHMTGVVKEKGSTL